MEKLWTAAYAPPVGHLAALVASAACTLAWHAVPSPPLWGAELRAVAATAGDDAWAVGGPAPRGRWTKPVVEHWNGRRWRVALIPAVQGASLRDVAAIARDDAWAVGGSLLEHWDGRRWHHVSVPWLTGLTAVSAVDGHDVWAVGSDLVAHWDGVRWQPRLRVAGVRDVTALGARDVWAVAVTGSRFVELHWDGRGWTRYGERISSESPTAIAVSGSGPGDVWAVGRVDQDGPPWPGAVLFHWTGERWVRAQPPPKISLSVNDLLAPFPGELWLTAFRGNGDAYGGGVREQLVGAAWHETETGRFVVIGLGADRAGGLWGVGSAGSYPNGLGFPTVDRPLVERARCS